MTGNLDKLNLGRQRSSTGHSSPRMSPRWLSLSCFSLLILHNSIYAQPLAPITPTTESMLQRATAHADEISQYEQTITELTSEYGPFDSHLLEPLRSLSDTLIESGNYNDAETLLDQQLQIHRISTGLYSAAQIPVVEKLLELRAANGEWQRVTDTLQYLSWVYQRDHTLSAEALLDGLKELGDWHLAALGQDGSDQEAFHLVQLRTMEEQATEIAKDYYGESEALVPFLYDKALADVYIALAITLTGQTSQDLMLLTEGIRNRVVSGMDLAAANIGGTTQYELEALFGSRASTVIERSFKSNMSANAAELKRIQAIYSASGNQEAEAMTLMALGDSILMRQQFERRPGNFAGIRRGTATPGPAMDYYEKALTTLREAGLSEQQIVRLTRCPVLLPITSFMTTLEEAKPPCASPDETALVDLGEYKITSNVIPGLKGELRSTDDQLSAVVQFKVRSNGQISGLQIVDIQPDNTANRVRVRKLSEIMQFRPAIEDGRSTHTELAQLIINMPASSQ